MNDICTDLPTERETGTLGSWLIEDDNGEQARLTGRFLGSGSSRSTAHRDHSPGTWATARAKCRACRWLELMIFQEHTDTNEGDAKPSGRYLVVKVGASEVPNEKDRMSFTWAYSPDEVVVSVSIRGEGGRMTMTRPAQTALARAAGYDPEIREAYRAVA